MLTVVVSSPKAFGGVEQVFLPQGDPVFTIRGFRPGSGSRMKKPDGTWEQGKDMIVTVKAFGERFEKLLTTLGEGFIIQVDGEFEVDNATGNPRIWTSKEGKVGCSFVFKAEKITPIYWGLKGKESAKESVSGSTDEVPF
jgi:hypothetical protein